LGDGFIIPFASARPETGLIGMNPLAHATGTDNLRAATAANDAEPIHKNGQGKADKNQQRGH